ncbi:hypothetical protein LAZ67_10000374 [Cordylochernes scorpioides]|uniref:Reverse transcriptase domain-containing protein n=1 Tax=Cordylochernes scorpioides TaxID=51811 RepID=A0ABY6KX59_9ARAC|nr:hypothetical protein LAZ67_10000374 [Cordylochernes scorpioides]
MLGNRSVDVLSLIASIPEPPKSTVVYGTKVATPFHTSSVNNILSGLPEFAHLNQNFARPSKPLNHYDSPCVYPPVMPPKHFEYGASPGAYSATFSKPLSNAGTFPSDDYLELEEEDNAPPSSPDSEVQAPQVPSSKLEQETPLPEAQDATSETTTKDPTPTDPLENKNEAPALPISTLEDQQDQDGACGNQIQDPAFPPGPPVEKNEAPATPRTISGVLIHDPGGPPPWTYNFEDQKELDEAAHSITGSDHLEPSALEISENLGRTTPSQEDHNPQTPSRKWTRTKVIGSYGCIGDFQKYLKKLHTDVEKTFTCRKCSRTNDDLRGMKRHVAHNCTPFRTPVRIPTAEHKSLNDSTNTPTEPNQPAALQSAPHQEPPPSPPRPAIREPEPRSVDLTSPKPTTPVPQTTKDNTKTAGTPLKGPRNPKKTATPEMEPGQQNTRQVKEATAEDTEEFLEISEALSGDDLQELLTSYHRQEHNNKDPPARNHQKVWIKKIGDEKNDQEKFETIKEFYSNLIKEQTIKRNNRKNKGANRERPIQKETQAHKSAINLKYSGEEAGRLQKAYYFNKKRTMQEILEGSSPLCNIPKKNLEAYFQKTMSQKTTTSRKEELRSLLVPENGNFTSEALDLLSKPISTEEVWTRLSKMGNTTPGPDGLSYADLKRLDPGAKVLTTIFDFCFRLQKILPQWKKSSTVLIYKKRRKKNNPENWRPIALGNTIGKLYSAIIADRIKRFATNTNLISSPQKGFLEYEGCLEHNFVLQSLIEETKRAGREICIGWIDLANAFGSVPHHLVFETLEASGIPENYIQIIRGLYKGASTTIKTKNGPTSEIPILCGVKQGCPLSPITFNIYIEPIVRTLEHLGRNLGFKVFDRITTTLAYADHLVITAKNREALDTLLDALSDQAAKAGLKVEPQKCATLPLLCRGRRRVLPTPFKIEGAPVPAMTKDESYLHLGVPTGFRKSRSLNRTLQDLETEVKKIDESLLTPWQKIDAIKTFVYPKLDFILRGAPIHKTNFGRIDRLIISLARSGSTSPNVPLTRLYTFRPPREVQACSPSATERNCPRSRKHSRCKYCKDANTENLAKTFLKRTVSRELGRSASGEDMADYLSGRLDQGFDRDGGDVASLWSEARNATRRLRNTLRARWTWDPDSCTLSVALLDAQSKTRTKIGPSMKHQLIGKLRQALEEHYLETLLLKRDQGKTFEVTCRNQCSNAFIPAGKYFRFATGVSFIEHA